MCSKALLFRVLKLVMCGKGLTLYLTTKFGTGPSNFKAFADDKLNVARTMSSLFDWVENMVGKGENPSHQHFLLFPQCF